MFTELPKVNKYMRGGHTAIFSGYLNDYFSVILNLLVLITCELARNIIHTKARSFNN